MPNSHSSISRRRLSSSSSSLWFLRKVALTALATVMMLTTLVMCVGSGGMLTTFALAAITTNPTQLITKMPFYVYSSDPSVTSVFMATASSCASSTMLGTPQGLSAPLYNALFQFSSQSTNTLYVCQYTGGTPIATLTFTPMTFTPQFFLRNTEQTITFSSNVPTNTLIRVKQYEDCATGTTAVEQYTSASNTITATTTSAFFYFMCVSALSAATGQLVTVNVGAIVSTEAGTVAPSTALKNEINTEFQVGGATPPNTRVVIASLNSQCATVLQGPVSTSGLYGKNFNMTVTVDRGTYMFCAENPIGSTIFVPSDTPLTVRAYTISPLTIFANTAVTFTLGGDIPDTFRLGWSTTGCQSPTWMKSPVLVTGRSVTETFILQTGQTSYTVSSCIYQNTVDARAVLGANHLVVQPYTATINRNSNDVVRGLSLSVTVSPNPITFVSLHMGSSCNGLMFASGNSSNYVFSTVVPLASTYPGAMVVCLRTLDGTATYAVRSAFVRNFILDYSVAIVSQPTFFQIDGALAVGSLVTPGYRFMIGNMDCTGLDAGFGILPATPNVTLTFPSATTYTFCARSYNVDFVAITTVQSFTLPTISPNATLTGVDTVIEVYNVPVGLTAIIGQTCDRATADQTQVRSSALPAVAFTINYPTGGYRLVCVFLPSANGTTSPFVAGNVTISSVSVTPTRAFQGQVTRFNIITSINPPILLQGSSAYITTTGAIGCSTSPTETPVLVTYNNGKPFVNLQVPTATGTIGVCVGGNTATGNAYLFGGSVAVIPGLITTFTPSIPVVNIPFSISFAGSFTPTVFAIASEADGCESPVVTGPLVGGATTSPVTITAAGNHVVCVEADPGSYLIAASITMNELEARPATYVRSTSTFLATYPALPADTTTLFLTAAGDCTGPRWFATAAAPLSAPIGTYKLCAQVVTGSGASGGGTVIAIAKNAVTVIDAYRLTMPVVPPPIRSFINFVIGVAGGDVAAAGFAAVFFIPQTSPTTGAELYCHNTTTTSLEIVSRFNSTTPSQMTVNIPAKEDVPYKLCVRTRDSSTAVLLNTITPASYITPSVVIKGVSTTITSGGMGNGYAIIAANSDCSGTRFAGPTQVANYLMDNVIVAASVTNTVGYYCESATNGVVNAPYNYRATVALVPFVTLPPLPAPSTYPPTTPIGFEDRTVPPATPVILSIPAEMGSRPFVSRFRNCSDVILGITTVGYIPGEFEVASFYVCARAPNGMSNFSMPQPNLHISKYQLSPTSIQASAPSPTTLTMVPPTATTNVWFSANKSCLASEAQVGAPGYLGAAVDFSTGIQSIATTHVGIVYICALDSRVVTVDSTVRVYVQISSLLSVGAPTLATGSAANPIQGIPWCLVRSVPKDLYSLVEGEDSGSPYAMYYTTTDRSVFLVNGSNACTLSNALTPVTTQTGTTGAAAQVCLPTAGLSNGSYRVCSGTPAGFVVTVTATMLVASPSPSSWVAGTLTLTHFPNMPLRSFLFVTSGTACSIANAASAPFTTNATSYAMVSTFTVTGDLPIAAGSYTLCAKVDQDSPSSAWTSVVKSVTIHRQQFFSLGVTTVTAGVPTTVPLGGDLRIGSLRMALSPALASGTSHRSMAVMAAQQSDAASFISPCGTTLDVATYGSIAPVVNETSAEGTYAVLSIPSPGRYVVCALTAVNYTMVPVATVTVVSPIVTFPWEVAACDVLPVAYPSAGAAANTQTTSMFLSSAICCTANATVGNTQTTLANIPAGSSSSATLRVVSVDDDRLDEFHPQTEFALCVSNSTFCVGAGYVTFTGSICTSVTITTPSDNNGNYTGGAASGWKLGRDNIPVTLLVIFFCVLLCCLIILVIICCCRRNRKVTPKEEDIHYIGDVDGEEMGDVSAHGRNKSANVRNRSAANNKTSTSTIAVPMDMSLFICTAPPVGAQVVENDEGRYRAIIEHQETAERHQFWEYFEEEDYRQRGLESERIAWAEEEAAKAAIVAAQRAEEAERERIRFAREARMGQIAAMLAELQIDEETSRLAIEESEDSVRLNIAEMEREMWRYHMEREGQLLHDRLESNHFQTQSRRRKLREANDRAFQSINEAAQQMQYNSNNNNNNNATANNNMSSYHNRGPSPSLGATGSGAAVIRSISPIRGMGAGGGGAADGMGYHSPAAAAANPFLVMDDGDYSTVGVVRNTARYSSAAHHNNSTSASVFDHRSSPATAAINLDGARPHAININNSTTSHAAGGGGIRSGSMSARSRPTSPLRSPHHTGAMPTTSPLSPLSARGGGGNRGATIGSLLPDVTAGASPRNNTNAASDVYYAPPPTTTVERSYIHSSALRSGSALRGGGGGGAADRSRQLSPRRQDTSGVRRSDPNMM